MILKYYKRCAADISYVHITIDVSICVSHTQYAYKVVQSFSFHQFTGAVMTFSSCNSS